LIVEALLKKKFFDKEEEEEKEERKNLGQSKRCRSNIPLNSDSPLYKMCHTCKHCLETNSSSELLDWMWGSR